MEGRYLSGLTTEKRFSRLLEMNSKCPKLSSFRYHGRKIPCRNLLLHEEMANLCTYWDQVCKKSHELGYSVWFFRFQIPPISCNWCKCRRKLHQELRHHCHLQLGECFVIHFRMHVCNAKTGAYLPPHGCMVPVHQYPVMTLCQTSW